MDENVKESMLDKVSIGSRIRASRKKLNYTQENIAEMLDISNSYYGQIERGDGTPSLPIFVGICTVLKVSPLVLLQDALPPLESDKLTDNEELIAKYKQLNLKQKAIIDYLLNDFNE